MKHLSRLVIACPLALAAALGSWWLSRPPGPPPRATAEQLRAAEKAYAKFGLRLSGTGGTAAGEVPLLSPPAGTTDAELGRLPRVPFGFGLSLEHTEATDAGLQALRRQPNLVYLTLPPAATDAGVRGLLRSPNLTYLGVSGTGVTEGMLKELAALGRHDAIFVNPDQLTDGVLRAFREAGQLHRLGQASAPRGRARRDEDITSLNLQGSRVTDAGAAEAVRDLKKLNSLQLDGAQITDRLLTALREADRLHTLHFGVFAGNPASDEDITKLYLHNTGVTDAGLKALRGLPDLSELSLPPGVTDSGLIELQDLGGLTKLRLDQTRVTDAGLKKLRALKRLALLTLPSGITDDGLKELRGLEHLTSLRLPPTVTDAGLRELKHLKNLGTLELAGGQLTPQGLAGFRHLEALRRLTVPVVTDLVLVGLRENGQLHVLPQAGGLLWNGVRYPPLRDDDITVLHLQDTRVTDAGLGALRGLKNLQCLSLPGGVTGAGLKGLGPLENLATLSLRGTRSRDVGVQELEGLDGLTTLDLNPAQVTDGVLRALREHGRLHILDRAHNEVQAGGGATHLFPGGQEWGLWPAGFRPSREEEVIELDLSGTGVTDAGLLELRGLRNLDHLDLRATGVTDAGVAERQEALPGCRISR